MTRIPDRRVMEVYRALVAMPEADRALSKPRMAAALGISRAALFEALSRLSEVGFIRMERAGRASRVVLINGGGG